MKQIITVLIIFAISASLKGQNINEKLRKFENIQKYQKYLVKRVYSNRIYLLKQGDWQILIWKMDLAYY